MDIDLADLVRQALLANGCDASVLGNFDSHSTISLEFNTLPDMLLSLQNDQVLIWMRLCEHHLPHIERCAPALVTLLMEEAPYAITDQMQISGDDGYTVLKCWVKPAALQDIDAFSNVLEAFYIRAEQFLEALR